MVASVFVLDTITNLGAEHRGNVVIAASHGAIYAGYCAAKGGVRGVILNDAGIGKDRAGISSLEYLDRIGLAAATADSGTCRIGDGADMRDHGKISFVNDAAKKVGCMKNQSVEVCAALMRFAAMPSVSVPPRGESRFVLEEHAGQPIVIAADSVSLLLPEDAGRIVVTASHGALLGGREDNVVSPALFAATFNDAGGGKDEIGYSRLPALDRRGIAAATVSSESARIGDARSAYDVGIVSRVNDTAARLGGNAGEPLKELVTKLVQARLSNLTQN
jgi:hypothetical protein